MPHHLLVVQLTGPVTLTLGINGRPTTKTVARGACTLVPGGEGFSIGIADCLESVHLYIREDLVDRVMSDRTCAGSSRLQLAPLFGVSDPLLEQLAIGCAAALRRGDSQSSLYVDHLAWAIAAHLVEVHAQGTSRKALQVGKTLSGRQLQRVNAFIESHLDQDVSVENLAQAAGLSPVYFARQFKRRTGVAPYRYLLAARIEQAKQHLIDDNMSIKEIALTCGFSHQEHLTHAFNTFCGTSPGAYRRRNRQA